MEKIISYGLIIFAFFLPLQTRLILHQGSWNNTPWEYGTFSIYGTEIVLWLIFIIATVAGFRKWVRQTHPPNFTNIIRVIRGALPISVILVILLAFASLSILWSQDRLIASRTLLTLAEGIGLFFVLVRIPLPIRHILYGFIVGMALQAGLGIYQFFAQSVFASTLLGMASHDPGVLGTSVVEAGGRWLRAYGSLPHPNILAGYLVVAIFLIYDLRFTIYDLENRNQKSKIKNLILFSTFYFLLSILTAALFFTFSRGSWVALGIGLAALTITGFHKWARQARPANFANIIRAIRGVLPISVIPYLFLYFYIFIFLSFIFWQPFSARILGQGRLETASYTERVSSLKQARDVIEEHPWFGTGIGNYTVALKQKDPTLSGWDLQPPHNIFLLILSELGIIGLILFFGFLFLFLKLPTTYYLLPTVIILGLFDHYLWSLYAGVMLFWLTCGLAASTTFKNTVG